MNLADTAILAKVGETRIYSTKSTQPQRVVIVSANVDGEGRLSITVRPEGESGGYFRVRVTSLSMPTTPLLFASCPDCGSHAPASTTDGPNVTAWCQECGSGWHADLSEFYPLNWRPLRGPNS